MGFYEQMFLSGNGCPQKSGRIGCRRDIQNRHNLKAAVKNAVMKGDSELHRGAAMTWIKSGIILSLMSLIFAAVPASGQSEAILKDYFEGRRVVVLVDMPADEDGINIEADRGRSIDRRDVNNDIRRYGVSIREMEPAEITLVKKKGKHIEFQLNGGGWQGGRSARLNYTPVPKSKRHKDIEAELALLPDPDDSEIPVGEKKLSLREILTEDLEQQKQEYDAVNAERLSLAQQNRASAQENLNRRILNAGSRFNLRFDRSVPSEALTPRGLMNMLEKYVDFSRTALDAAYQRQRQSIAEAEVDDPVPNPAEDAIEPASAGEIMRVLRKGLAWADVRDLLGPPSREDFLKDGTMDVRKCRFEQTSLGIIEGDFVEDILIRYTISSR